MSIIIDLIEGAGGRKSEDGWELTRVATVTGLSGNGHSKLKDAVDAVISAVGDIGSPHPGVSECVIVDFTPTAKTSDKVDVRISYKENHEDDPDYAEIEFQTNTSQVETNKDSEGNLIELFHTYTEKSNPMSKWDQPVSQNGMVSKLVPETTLTYTRFESTSPGAKSLEYSGTVNSGDFDPVGTAAARTWLCTSISGKRVRKPSSSGITEQWQTTYTFQYRADTWDQTALYIDPTTSRPIPEGEIQSDDEVEVVVQVYEEKDFDLLNL